MMDSVGLTPLCFSLSQLMSLLLVFKYLLLIAVVCFSQLPYFLNVSLHSIDRTAPHPRLITFVPAPVGNNIEHHFAPLLLYVY